MRRGSAAAAALVGALLVSASVLPPTPAVAGAASPRPTTSVEVLGQQSGAAVVEGGNLVTSAAPSGPGEGLTIRTLAPDGTSTSSPGPTHGTAAAGLLVDSSGRLWSAGLFGPQLSRRSLDGQWTLVPGSPWPTALATGPLAEGPDGTVWLFYGGVGNGEGAVAIDPDTLASVVHDHGVRTWAPIGFLPDGTFVALDGGAAVSVDLLTGEVLDQLSPDGAPTVADALPTDDGHLWLALSGGDAGAGALGLLDPATQELELHTDPSGLLVAPKDLAARDADVWATGTNGLTRLRPADGGAGTVHLDTFATPATARQVWTANGARIWFTASDTNAGPWPLFRLGDVTASFTDVSPTHPFAIEVAWLAGRGITDGYPDGTFRPGAVVTRQAMAAFLHRFAGDDPVAPPAGAPFTDVGLDHPFLEDVAWAVDEGITSGYADGTFRPGAPVTRQAMAAFLHRLAGADLPDGALPTVPTWQDVPAAHPFSADVEWLAHHQLASGWPDGTFRPAAPVTRQATASFLFQLDLRTRS